MTEADISPQQAYLLKGKSLQELLRSIKKVVAGPGLAYTDLPTGERVLYVVPTAARVGSLCITAARPAYVPAPSTGPAVDSKRLWVTMGTVNDKLAANWADSFDIAANTWFWLKVEFSENIDRLEVTAASIVHGTTEDAETSGAWGAAGEFPSHVVVPLGYVDFDSLAIQNFGRGSLTITAVLSNISQDVDGHSTFHRMLNYVRLEGAVT